MKNWYYDGKIWRNYKTGATVELQADGYFAVYEGGVVFSGKTIVLNDALKVGDTIV